MADKKAHAVYKTRNDVPSNAKKVSMELLNARLADSIDLALAIKQAHWNIKGPQFIGVHLMLDQMRDDMDGFVDKFAERLTSLGGTAKGTVQVVAHASSLPPYPTDAHTIKDHLEALIERFGMVANAVRKAIDDTDEAGDIGTSDLFTEATRALDKNLWFLEAHVQEAPAFD